MNDTFYHIWIKWNEFSLWKQSLITTTAFVPKDIAIKMNLLLQRILNEQNDMQQCHVLFLKFISV